MNTIEKIAREYGPVTVAYVIENYDPDPEKNMVWTVSMLNPVDKPTFDPETMEPTGNVIEGWHDHEHGLTLKETAEALYEQLKREYPDGYQSD